MNAENTKKLLKRFPHLYYQYYWPMTHTCMCWGFDCGDGWFDIIWQLSLAIEDELKLTKFKWLLNTLKVKFAEKWNLLMWKFQPKFMCKKVTVLGEYPRFMMRVDHGFSVSQVKEKYGTLRFYCSGNDRVFQLTNLAERASELTCEQCGQYGKMRGHSWLYVACDEHTKEQDLDPIDPSEDEDFDDDGSKGEFDDKLPENYN